MLNVVASATPAQREFIEDMGQYMIGWGVPRTTGRIYGYLLMQPKPVGLDEIVRALGIAKSGASVATRQLVQFGLARTSGQRGSRRLLYEAYFSLEAIVAARDQQSRLLRDRFLQGAAAAPPGPGRKRLGEMAEMIEMLMDQAPELLKRMRQRRKA
jgi:hypothetical protein